MSGQFRAKKEPLFGAVDDELYKWLEVIYLQYISGWYPNVSPNGHFDQDLADLLVKAVSGLKERGKFLDKFQMVKELTTILDHHIRDVEFVLDRSRVSSEQIQTYLAMNSHPGMVDGQLKREYLDILATRHINGMFRDLPEGIRALLIGLFGFVLWQVVDLLSNSWTLYRLFISIRKNCAENSKKDTPKKKPEPHGPIYPDLDANITTFLVHRGHPLVKLVYDSLWWFHEGINARVNAFVFRSLESVDQTRVAKLLCRLRNKVFPNGKLVHSQPRPSLPEQTELEIEAQSAVSFFGMPLLSMKTLQHKAINQRLLLYLLDYLTTTVWPLDDVRSTWSVFLRTPGEPNAV